MFYLQMRPCVSKSSAATSITPSRPSRPRSAAPTIAVSTILSNTPAPLGAMPSSAPVRPPDRVSTGVSPRASYVGFAPRSPVGPRPLEPAITTLGATFEHVVYAEACAKSTTDYSRREQNSTEPTNAPALATAGNVYHATMARKSAEETERQLARRIAHFRAQEERVLREVHQMKQRLENLLESHESNDEILAPEDGSSISSSTGHVARRPLSASIHASRLAEARVPRSREQLQLLTKQRRVIQHRKSESARKQKEKRQEALNAQLEKDAAEQCRRVALKERIQCERQLAIDQRAARQQQLLDTLEQQHHARLCGEQTRELAAKQRISEMREEEKNVTLRLQALQVHQEHMKRGLEESLQSPTAPQSLLPRPKSARPPPRLLQ